MGKVNNRNQAQNGFFKKSNAKNDQTDGAEKNGASSVEEEEAGSSPGASVSNGARIAVPEIVLSHDEVYRTTG